MEAEPHCSSAHVTEGGAIKDHSQSAGTLVQPRANGAAAHHSSDEAPPTLPHRSADASSSDESLMDSSCTNDVSRLRSGHPSSGTCTQKAAAGSSGSSPPICAPPSPSFNRLGPPPLPPPSSLRSSTCSGHLHHHHHHRHDQQRTNQKRPSSTKSHASFKLDAAHIKEAAGDGRADRSVPLQQREEQKQAVRPCLSAPPYQPPPPRPRQARLI
ncbi:atrophin-1 isoform X2 [Salarias fasciatus]|uniref:atrophin-1 isoform X2 n=1 Tax=Salarias fasciatus TaxID=181472 RepID=UPI0011769C4E|nr:atrophin-1-like isoform X2 [Salarias fasciatus]